MRRRRAYRQRARTCQVSDRSINKNRGVASRTGLDNTAAVLDSLDDSSQDI
jgi:hypothetical protein